MNLYLVTCDGTPDIYIKAKTKKEAVAKWSVGFEDPKLFVEDKSFQVQLVTMKLLMAKTPDEFGIHGDTSF